jgi:hypothetical protein
VLQVFSYLMRIGEAPVTLRNGQLATVTWADDKRDRTQRSLVLLTDQRDPVREYTVDAQLMFELPASIHIRAGSATEATTAAKAVLRGSQTPPEDFAVQIHQEDIESFFNTLDYSTGHPAGMGIQHVTVTGVAERLLLGEPS